MYERFTDRARKIFVHAKTEAQKLNHEYIGTEHILLGLIKEGGGVGCHALFRLGINLQQVREAVLCFTKPGPEFVTLWNFPQTPRAKKVVEGAIESARELNHNHVGTEHILLGLLKVTDGVAWEVLNKLNLSADSIKQEVNNLLGINTASLIHVDKVELLAVKGHARQKRSDGSDYINHPRNVRARLVNYGIKDKDTLATAYLHDLLEDTPITEKEIEEVAGVVVLEAVKQLTNIVPKGTSFEEKTQKMLEHAGHYNDIAKRVKLADRYDNLADAIWTWSPERVKRYAVAGLHLIEAMQPLPDDMKEFEIEARRFFSCLI